MANGQIVLVTTIQISGEEPTPEVWFVAEEDPSKAEAIVKEHTAPNEIVKAVAPLPEVAVRALGLKPGEFNHA
jgi:hypothetical protein